jgi:dipeptidase E
MPCWFGAAVPCICATGCGNPDLPTSCRGTSGGAMVATPDFGGATYDESEPLTGSDKALGLVDFSVFPHLDREDGIPASPPEEIEAWAAGLSVPAYVIDDQTAIKVVDGTVEVVSEGHWKLLNASPQAS